jgi:hypothetical protein
MRAMQYYKHEEGRDCVIWVERCLDTGSGYQVMALWHILKFDGEPIIAAGQTMTEYTWTYEEAGRWLIYEPGGQYE